MANKILIKSFIVGITVLLVDYLAHTFYANPETFFYFLLKPIISGYIAYYMFENKLNFFNIKNKIGRYFYYSVYFAIIHSLYYRLIELFITKTPLFSRVGNIDFGFITFEGTLLSLAVGWLIIHGGSYLIGTLLVEQLDKRRLI